MLPQIPPPCILPQRLVPNLTLPPFRYVPGLYTHPSRSVGQHLGIDKHLVTPQKNWKDDTAWLYGLDLFNFRFYWESHEVWEEPWKMLPNDDPYRIFLQGMIKASASILKRHMGHHRPADLLWASAQDLLDTDAEVFRGVVVDDLVGKVKRFHYSGEWPVLSIQLS